MELITIIAIRRKRMQLLTMRVKENNSKKGDNDKTLNLEALC